MQKISGVVGRAVAFAGAEVHRIDAAEFLRVDDDGWVDLGTIDLRGSLVSHRVRVRESDKDLGGLVRVGMWIGSPPRGPRGELPSLGSKQFPPVELGGEMEWLLAPDAGAVYLLVERPDGPGRGVNWQSGKQQLFGPYESSSFPLELWIE